MLAFRRNRGLRIDHILLSPALAARCTACTIDREPRKWEQPSDHTPVIATLGVGWRLAVHAAAGARANARRPACGRANR